MNTNELMTINIEYPRYSRKQSVSLSDESSWREVLDVVLYLIQMPGGYSIQKEQLIEWANESDEGI